MQSNLSVDDLTFEGISDASFTYDANGNLINGKGLAYIYDDANRLSEVRFASNSTLIAKYYYDAAGNRVKKVSGGVTTYYIGDYLETRVKGAQRNDTSYYFANSERVARKDADGSKYYYHGDHLGSTSIVTNASGGVVESVAYLPYGETQTKTGSGSTYLYTDQELDPESALYYYGARYYWPEIMRFVEPDSVIQDMFNPQNLNRYSYVLNNPLKYTDPEGNLFEEFNNYINQLNGAVKEVKNYVENNWGSILSIATTEGSEATQEMVKPLEIVSTANDLQKIANDEPGSRQQITDIASFAETTANPLSFMTYPLNRGFSAYLQYESKKNGGTGELPTYTTRYGESITMGAESTISEAISNRIAIGEDFMHNEYEAAYSPIMGIRPQAAPYMPPNNPNFIDYEINKWSTYFWQQFSSAGGGF